MRSPATVCGRAGLPRRLFFLAAATASSDVVRAGAGMWPRQPATSPGSDRGVGTRGCTPSSAGGETVTERESDEVPFVEARRRASATASSWGPRRSSGAAALAAPAHSYEHSPEHQHFLDLSGRSRVPRGMVGQGGQGSSARGRAPSPRVASGTAPLAGPAETSWSAARRSQPPRDSQRATMTPFSSGGAKQPLHLYLGRGNQHARVHFSPAASSSRTNHDLLSLREGTASGGASDDEATRSFLTRQNGREHPGFDAEDRLRRVMTAGSSGAKTTTCSEVGSSVVGQEDPTAAVIHWPRVELPVVGGNPSAALRPVRVAAPGFVPSASSSASGGFMSSNRVLAAEAAGAGAASPIAAPLPADEPIAQNESDETSATSDRPHDLAAGPQTARPQITPGSTSMCTSKSTTSGNTKHQDHHHAVYLMSRPRMLGAAAGSGGPPGGRWNDEGQRLANARGGYGISSKWGQNFVQDNAHNSRQSPRRGRDHPPF